MPLAAALLRAAAPYMRGYTHHGLEAHATLEDGGGFAGREIYVASAFTARVIPSGSRPWKPICCQRPPEPSLWVPMLL